MENRLFRYLMARLRHEAWHRSIQVTIDAGFIQEEDKFVEGFKVRFFHSCTAVPEAGLRKLESLLGGFNANQNKCVAAPELDELELLDSQAWSGSWIEPDVGTKKLTGYRPGSHGRDDQTGNMSTIVKRSRIAAGIRTVRPKRFRPSPHSYCRAIAESCRCRNDPSGYRDDRKVRSPIHSAYRNAFRTRTHCERFRRRRRIRAKFHVAAETRDFRATLGRDFRWNHNRQARPVRVP